MEQILLYPEGVVGSDALAADINVSVCYALIGDVLVISAVYSVFVGICKALHDEHRV